MSKIDERIEALYNEVGELLEEYRRKVERGELPKLDISLHNNDSAPQKEE